jgi:hypothetical protein
MTGMAPLKLPIYLIRNKDGKIEGGIEASAPTSAKISGVIFHEPFLKNMGLCACDRKTSQREGCQWHCGEGEHNACVGWFQNCT